MLHQITLKAGPHPARPFSGELGNTCSRGRKVKHGDKETLPAKETRILNRCDLKPRFFYSAGPAILAALLLHTPAQSIAAAIAAEGGQAPSDQANQKNAGAEGKDWFPFNPKPDPFKEGSAIDLRFLNEK